MSKQQQRDTDESEEESAQIEDIEQLTQRLELEQIHEARQDVMSVRNNASQQVASAHSSQMDEAITNGRRVYLDVVKTLCLQLAPLIRQYQNELWEDTRLITGDAQLTGSEYDGKKIKRHTPPQHTIAVDGMGQFLHANFPLDLEYEVITWDSATGDTAHTVTQSWHPTFDQIDNVVIEIDQARHELGLGVDMDEGDDVWEIQA